MVILKGQGRAEILTTQAELDAQMLRIEEAGRTCYQSHKQDQSLESAQKFIQMLIAKGHESVLEHSCLTVRFDNTSRGFSHELVRHRLMSPSQESTRYVDYAKAGDEDPDLDHFQLHFVTPPHRDEKEKISITLPFDEDFPVMLTPEQMAQTYETFYRALRKAGWRPEDARQFLPIGTRSQVVITANLREWRHIFVMRCGRPAHWEIRHVMVDLLERCQKLIPGVFDDFEYKGTCGNGIPFWGKKEKHHADEGLS